MSSERGKGIIQSVGDIWSDDIHDTHIQHHDIKEILSDTFDSWPPVRHQNEVDIHATDLHLKAAGKSGQKCVLHI